jgi:hypothetical protein
VLFAVVTGAAGGLILWRHVNKFPFLLSLSLLSFSLSLPSLFLSLSLLSIFLSPFSFFSLRLF